MVRAKACRRAAGAVERVAAGVQSVGCGCESVYLCDECDESGSLVVGERRGVEIVDLLHVVVRDGRLWLVAVDLHGMIARPMVFGCRVPRKRTKHRESRS